MFRRRITSEGIELDALEQERNTEALRGYKIGMTDQEIASALRCSLEVVDHVLEGHRVTGEADMERINKRRWWDDDGMIITKPDGRRYRSTKNGAVPIEEAQGGRRPNES